MLPDSLDPDQDLQSGSKLFTWYDVCCNIRGGGFRPGGLCPTCKIQRGGGDYVLLVKFSGGDYVLVVKFMGGILSTYTKMSRGGFVRGGLCPYPFRVRSTAEMRLGRSNPRTRLVHRTLRPNQGDSRR